MKTPRDLDADDLLKLLRRKYGYEFVRQAGSHIRIRTQINGEHLQVSKQEIINELFA